ncbi:MAG: class I poly(R)-hydroxyalkanoic acid synthase [Brachymonas sp.]|nr:class I poly(R)-hydroxyalkanoic acid synthase [Brachymonas sp.]
MQGAANTLGTEWMQAMQAAWLQVAGPWKHAMPSAGAADTTDKKEDASAWPFHDYFAAAGTASEAFANGFGSLRMDTDRMLALQQQYLTDIRELFENKDPSEAIAQDRRFASAFWQKQPVSSFAAALHLANTRLMQGMAEAVQGDPQACGRVRFAVEQWTAAAAPSNFLAFNADAQQKVIDSQGESIARGIQNLLADVQKGHVSMTDDSQFEVGRNVGTSEGAVVFENELFQLIEYKPLTDKVHERPFLMVPACINKYYILDLQPDNSVVRFTVEQGHHTFIMSWRNPDASMADVTWDDYIEKGPITAMEKVLEITGAKKLNVLGFCVGGTILATALAVLAARKKQLAHSATFLTCLLDFSNPGVLGLFIDEAFVRWRETQFAQGGILPAGDLLNTFSFLRPNDLVWNYVVGNYLKGETPPPFDLLYWNCDSTNLPGPMYAWYLRNAYQNNLLMQPGTTTVCGEKVDFGKVKLPTYLYGSREDHIVPIEGAYASTQILPGEKRFVMGASGHIAGVINPLKKNKRSYWTNDALPPSHAEWLQGATEHAGSWWGDWAQWLAKQGGRMVAAPRKYGSASHAVIEPAPGRYVKAKAKEIL